MNILFWILMIGASATMDQAERLWFGEQLVQVKKMADINSWIQAKQLLADVAWPGSVNELARHRRIWEKMEEAIVGPLARCST
jgi:hypothetical protein